MALGVPAGLRHRRESVSITLRNGTKFSMDSVAVHVFDGVPEHQFEVVALAPGEQREIVYPDPGLCGGYSMTVRPAGRPAYKTEERLALGGHRLTEIIGETDSDWNRDRLSRIYDEDFMARWSGWLLYSKHK